MKVVTINESVAQSIIRSHKYANSDEFLWDAIHIEALLELGLLPDEKLVDKVCSALMKNGKGIETPIKDANFPTLEIKYGKLLFTVMFGQGTSMEVKLA